ncbi:MAG: thioesterase [Actinomycetia bacterium]|nr:thioesterase [Actinomycetes bacterium]MCP4221855.1 thioesterase [Actinomycetes bacterium]MCP5031745.1 thioesterase [Actinomycetes bacterium]
MSPVPGLVATTSLTVSGPDTAREIGSGSVLVLATPRLLALCEEATIRAVANHLDPGLTTVGVQVRLDHVGPSPIGSQVSAEATLEKVAGRKLFFTVSAHDDRGLVAAGKVTRVIVDEEEFMAKCDA